jgi:hypothetical protein
MTLNLRKDYLSNLLDQKPTVYKKQIIQPPAGSMSAPTIIPPLTIPSLNTIILYDDVTTVYKIGHYLGLAAEETPVPENFNWRIVTKDDTPEIVKKKEFITTPGNQALCGSCWAIAGAGMTSDNFVVSDVVDYHPNLSTTWSLSCNPQHRCKGGNPAVLFRDIARNGIASNNCVDYSWCMENENCNGDAKKHFKEANKTIDLSDLVPKCGCVQMDEHYLYKIDKSITSIYIGAPKINNAPILAAKVKRHIFLKGPVLGSFLVFKNFMKGAFTQIESGIYFEDGIYDKHTVTFDDSQYSPDNYAGSHAISIIGWGVEKNVNTSKGVKDVPYWYCRNSWSENWGDGGYFKFAMHPFNQHASCFEKQITLKTSKGNFKTGGIVMISAVNKPHLVKSKLNGEDEKKLLQDPTYYQQENNTQMKTQIKTSILPSIEYNTMLNIVVIVILMSLLIGLLYYNGYFLKWTSTSQF